MPDDSLGGIGYASRATDSDGQLGDSALARPDADHTVKDIPSLSRGTVLCIGILIAALLVTMFFIGWLPHARRLAAADAEAVEATNARPAVDTLTARPSSADPVLLLPADIRPNQATDIYARTSGYLKPLPAGIDIGAHVASGQIIAEIAAPDLDAELDQARAVLEQARVSITRAEQQYLLDQSTLSRYEAALEGHSVSAQDVDERRTQQRVGEATLEEARASMIAAQAAVNRLLALQAFERIVAPFSGVLTARGYDSGALVNAGDKTGRALFRIEQTDVLRVAVDVPQSEATDMQLGQPAEVLVRNFPGRVFAGTVARWAASLNASTRTMLVQIDVPNEDGAMLPGMYGQVRIHLHRDHPALLVPSSALLYGPEGVHVVLLKEGIARYQAVTLGRDLGAEAEIVAGLSETDVIVNNPGQLKDGAEVTLRKR